MYQLSGPEQLKKSRLIATRKTLPRGWSLSVTINPYGTVDGWSNILHATIGKNDQRYGDRTPGIWFIPKTTKLHICSAVNGKLSYWVDTHAIPLHKNSLIRIEQSQSRENHQYYYQIFINEKRVCNILNKNPQSFNNVKYYASDPWFEPAHATISNFKLTVFKHKGKY